MYVLTFVIRFTVYIDHVPPAFNMSSSIEVEANTQFILVVTVLSPDLASLNMTVQPIGSTSNGTLPTIVYSNGVFSLSWPIGSVPPPAFQLLAIDSFGASAMWSPNIYFCACQNGGVCQGINSSVSSGQDHVYLETCHCPGAFSGFNCQLDPCNSLPPPCYPGAICTIVNGSSYQCGPCPVGNREWRNVRTLRSVRKRVVFARLFARSERRAQLHMHMSDRLSEQCDRLRPLRR